jgi:hypothetical protein
MQMQMQMQEGTSSTIERWKPGIIQKKQKRRSFSLSVLEQRKIHRIIYDCLKTYKILKTPKIYYDTDNPNAYLMQEINTDNPIWLGDPSTYASYSPEYIAALIKELQQLWKHLWNSGYSAWDFELYVQPNNNVMILDFDKFGKKINYFFDHICFPQGFET